MVSLALALGACGPSDLGGGGGDAGGERPPPDAAPSDPDATAPPGEPGASCGCDDDCAAVEGHEGICVFGVCMTRASAACSAAGSEAECPDGSGCWGLQGADGYLCWPECDAYDCAGSCDPDGSCVPGDSSDCAYACSSYCACEEGDCAAGEQCVSGRCVPMTGDGPPGAGPGPACPDLPPRDCTGGNAHCSQLVQFSPPVTPHYEDYPLNGETAQDQYRSWLRRDVRMLIDYATAKTLCKAETWDTGDGGPLGLGDMSEQNGAIPGTSIGQPGHPENTHTGGNDIDLAYYQVGQPNNHLRPVCPHVSGGEDQYHCVGEPDILDVWRTALFLGYLFESPRVRVVGVDGKIGPSVVSAISELCQTDWLSADACNNVQLAYETTNMGYGWYYFHHHHAHVSLLESSYATGAPRPVLPCKVPGCEGVPLKPHPLARELNVPR